MALTTTNRTLRAFYGIGSWLVTVAITLIGLAALTFFIGRVVPIDPVLRIVGEKATPDVCDLILHHSRGGTTASYYDFATLEGPVRSALVAWADHIENVAAEKEKAVSNVRAIVRA